VAAAQPPRAVALVLAAEFFSRRRIVSRCCPVTHSSQLRCGEELHLAHVEIIPQPRFHPNPRMQLIMPNRVEAEPFLPTDRVPSTGVAHPEPQRRNQGQAAHIDRCRLPSTISTTAF
jgi:hypothetical protein